MEAAAELAEAVAYYDGLLSGLGSELAAEIRDGIRRIEEHPKAWPLMGDDIRPRISCTIGERMWQDRWGGMDFR
jgi:hypothetical protein